MTEEEFRSNDLLRNELAAALSVPAFMAANALLDKRSFAIDAVANAPEIVSVRLLSCRAGVEGRFNDLRLLCQPNPAPPEDKDPEPDWETTQKERDSIAPLPEP